jgi:hypothetical protein
MFYILFPTWPERIYGIQNKVKVKVIVKKLPNFSGTWMPSIPSQMNPVHIFPSYSSQIGFNIISISALVLLVMSFLQFSR